MGNLLGMIAYGANYVVGFLKWAALIYVLIRIVLLGFSILTQAKNGADAISKIKGEGVALAIGLCIVLSAFLIHGALKDSISNIGGTGSANTNEITVSDTDSWSTNG